MKLGDELKDKVSGLVGTAVGRVEYLNGCVRFILQPKLDKDGKFVEEKVFDEHQLEWVGQGFVRSQASVEESAPKLAATGGPFSSSVPDNLRQR